MKCLNGHEISANESFCTTCGSKAESTPGFSSLRPPSATPPPVEIPAKTRVEWDAPKKGKLSNPKVVVPAIIGVAALLLIFVVAFGNSSTTMTVITTQYHATCADLDSSDSVFNGAEVRVKDPNRKVVGSGAYGSGEDGRDDDSHGNRVDTCTFTTNIQVPNDLTSYKVDVDDGEGITFQLDELKNNDWEAYISVGYTYNDTSFSDGYNWGFDNAYYSSDCNWYRYGPVYDDSDEWERGCRAGWLDN